MGSARDRKLLGKEMQLLVAVSLSRIRRRERGWGSNVFAAL